MGATELIDLTLTNAPPPTSRKPFVYPEAVKSGENLAGQIQSSSPSSTSLPFLAGVKGSTEDEIVISGMAGRLPGAENLEEFAQNLFNGVDGVTENSQRWPPGLHGLPRRTGTLRNLDKFDAMFFKVPGKQAHPMDPQLRLLMELTFETIMDAGINPMTIRGSRTGVFIGTSWTEVEPTNGPEDVKGYTQQSAVRAMLANRLSYAFDLTGPSFTLDTACSSGLMALHQAVAAIKLGHCDAAVVGGINLCLDPMHCLRFLRLKILSPDGKCKSFDASADGYARSEGAAMLFIQKRREAVRFYASILHIKTNTDGYKTSGPVTPSRRMQGQLLQEIYSEAGVNPDDVVFLEAHGTGTVVGDRAELNALEDVFGPGRNPDRPLLIGAVKTSIGHTEPASGIISVIKVLLSMQRGLIPANLHYKNPNPDSPALCNGTFKMITENTPFTDGGIVGVSSFGFGGVNVHTILKSNPKKVGKNSQNLPYLIPFSGRTKEAVQHGLTRLTTGSPQFDPNLVALVRKIFQTNVPGHDYRGYVIIDPKMPTSLSPPIKIQGVNSQRPQRPVWFIFSGMGSQWTAKDGGGGMGRDLLKLQVFSESLKKPAQDLQNFDPTLDLYKILQNGIENQDGQNNIVETMIAITAMQVGLVDLLRSIGISPSGGMVGHSLGEIGCAYADNCLTSSQAVLAAYARGKAIQDSRESLLLANGAGAGAMAVIGLTWEEAKTKCPAEIYPACHNGAQNVTVSGPLDKIEEFLEQLEKDKIFAKKINSMSTPFHSPYVAPAGPKLKKIMDTIIPNSEIKKSRSKNWITTSVPRDQWKMIESSGVADADYFVNNFLSPVLFHDALTGEGGVPENAVVVEIAPHGLMQPILKRSLGSGCVHVPLMDKNCEDGLEFFFNAVGQMYNTGLNPVISHLYEERDHTQFPVAMETGMVAPLVMWDHSVRWEVPKFLEPKRQTPGKSFTATLGSDLTSSSSFYRGHKIDGHYLFPAAAYIDMVWKTFAQLRQVPMDQLPIILEDVQVTRPVILQDGVTTKFFVTISPSNTGHFTIAEGEGSEGGQGNSPIVTGTIRTPADPQAINLEMLDLGLGQKEEEKNNFQTIPQTANDVYKFLRLQGHQYGGHFRTILEARGDGDGIWGKILNKDHTNVTCLLDGMAQLYFLTLKNTQGVICLPTGIKKMVINPQILLKSSVTSDTVTDTDTVEVTYTKNLDVLQGPGIEIRGFVMRFAPRRHEHEVKGQVVLEEYTFSPFFDHEPLTPSSPKVFHKGHQDPFQFCVDLALQNITKVNLNVLEILSKTVQKEGSMAPKLEKYFQKQIHKKCHLTSVHEEEDKIDEENFQNDEPQPGILKIKNLLQSKKYDLVLLHDDDFENLEKNSFEVETTNHFFGHHSFLLLHLRNGISKKNNFKFQNFTLVAHKILKNQKENEHLYLFRNKNETVGEFSEINSIFIEISHTTWTWLEQLQGVLKAASMSKNPPTIYLTSQCGPESGILGLTNCLRLEPAAAAAKLRCYFNMDEDDRDKLNFRNRQDDPELTKILENDLFINVYKNGQWGSYSHFDLNLLPSKKLTSDLSSSVLFIHTTTIGDLTSLKWIQGPKISHDNLCLVHYTSVNQFDLQLATGQIPPDTLPPALACKEGVLGTEFSGLQNSIKIMGIVATSAMASVVQPHCDLTWTVPPEWTMAEAASVPLAYSVAYYALILEGQLDPFSSLLVHSALTPVGQAAISIAQNMNCVVYAIVETEEEKEILENIFPKLRQNQIILSIQFEQSIYVQTGGHGVDVILNCFQKSPQNFKSTVKCLAPKKNGRFLDLTGSHFGDFGGDGGQFFSINFFDIFKNSQVSQKLSKLVNAGLQSGAVRPIECLVFEKNELEKAFRAAAASASAAGGAGNKNFGKKILIKVHHDEDDEEISTDFVQRVYFSAQKSYIIIGGLGGFGLALAAHLVDRGAKKLVLVSRSGITTGYQSRCVTQWRENGVQVMTPTRHNVATEEGAENLLLETIGQFGPVGGVFNLGMVLKDGFFEGQTIKNFVEVIVPKIEVTRWLDKACRKVAPTSLDHFVTFSSISSGRGNVGQTNYGFANSYMERICESRQKDDLPALAIQWGPIGDVGIIQERLGDGHLDIELGGCVPQRIWSCLQTLDTLLLHQWTHPVTSSMSIMMDTDRSLTNERSKLSKEKISLTHRLAQILGMTDISTLNPQTSLPELGLDSLMAMELIRLLERDYNLILPPSELRKLTVAKIMEIDARASASSASDDHVITTSTVKNFDEKCPDQKDPIERLAPEKFVENSQPIVPQKTKPNWQKLMPPQKTIVEMRSKASARDGQNILFLVHPIEGHVHDLDHLASQLDHRVIGLQWSKEVPTGACQSVESLAEFYVQKIKTIQPTGPYDIAGYSFGCQVTIELALQLERDNGVVRNLFLLDGSWLQTGFDRIKFCDDDKLVTTGNVDEVDMLSTFLVQFDLSRVQVCEIRNELSHYHTSEVRMARTVDWLHSLYPSVSLADLKVTLDSFMDRMRASEKYRPGYYIHARFVLVKAKENKEAEKFEKDYSLEKISWEKVQIHEVGADHRSLIVGEAGVEVAKIINDYLRPHLEKMRVDK